MMTDAPRRPLTGKRVVDLTLEIIGADGLAALSMRRLVAAAGVKPMSLYHHFPNKQAVLDGVGEALSAKSLPGTDPGSDGREAVRRLFVGLHSLVRAHPRALPLLSTAVVRTPSGRRWMEELMRLLREAEASPAEAARAYHVLGAYTLGWGYARLLSLDVPPGAIIGQFADQRGDHPHLPEAGIPLATWDDPGESERGLDVLLTRAVRLTGWAGS